MPKRKVYAVILAAALVLAAVAAVGWAAEQKRPNKAKADKGAVPGKAASGMKWGYLKATPETKKTWQELERLMVRRHRLMWELFELRSQDNPDPDAIRAKLEQLRKTVEQAREARRALARNWVGGKEGCERGPGIGRGRMGFGPMGRQGRVRRHQCDRACPCWPET